MLDTEIKWRRASSPSGNCSSRVGRRDASALHDSARRSRVFWTWAGFNVPAAFWDIQSAAELMKAIALEVRRSFRLRSN
jgi:hypothetical protein